jgi:hypothetical protein
MSDIPEALGTAVEGVAMARVLEPLHGEKSAEGKLDHGHFAESACLNCAAPLAGHYCSSCGQAAHLHRTFGAFLHDIAHGVLHFDGKTWRTLPMLAGRPGRLTRDYIEGHRARYVSPMALFLFSVFLMFAVFQFAGLGAGEDVAVPAEVTSKALSQEGDKVVLAQNGDGKIKLTAVRTGSAFVDHAIAKWQANPGLMLYKLQSSSYKYSWLLIPLSLPFVWLIFAWRRRFGLYDHAVFITYSIAFMTLLFMVLTVAGRLGVPAGLVTPLMLFLPLAHIFAHVKGAYELRTFSALWRTFALLIFIAIVALLFGVALVALGAM